MFLQNSVRSKVCVCSMFYCITPREGRREGQEGLWLARDGGILTNGNIPNWHRTVNTEQPSEIYDLPQD